MVSRRYSAKTRAAPARGDTSSLCLFEQVVVELVCVGRICPIWLGLGEGTTTRALTTGTIAIHDRVDDQPVCAAMEQLLTELLDPAIGQTGADRYLSAYTGRARSSHQFPALPQEWSTFEALEIGLVVGLDGN